MNKFKINKIMKNLKKILAIAIIKKKMKKFREMLNLMDKIRGGKKERMKLNKKNK